MATKNLQMDDLHAIIDGLGSEIGFSKDEDFEVCVVDEKDFKVYRVKEVYADKTPGQRILSIVINSGESN